MYDIGYDFMNREDNPFPPAAEGAAPKVLSCHTYQGSAYANVGERLEWHIDFVNSHGSCAILCQNVLNGTRNYTIYHEDGRVEVR